MGASVLRVPIGALAGALAGAFIAARIGALAGTVWGGPDGWGSIDVMEALNQSGVRMLHASDLRPRYEHWLQGLSPP